MNREVVITGMGAITPVGKSIEEYWNSLVSGVCGIKEIQGYDDFELPVRIAGQITDFDASVYGIAPAVLRKCDRYTQFAMAAAEEAVKSSGILDNQGISPERIGVYIGSGIGGLETFVNETQKLYNQGVNRVSPLFVPMMISNIASGQIAIRYGLQGPTLPVVTACATSTNAVGEAYRAIKHGYADAIVAGGSEAAIHPLVIGGFNSCKALSRTADPMKASRPFDRTRDGFVLGEGSGILILEEKQHAIERGAHIYAEVCGYGNTCDAYHYTAPRPDATTEARAIKLALDEAGYKAGEKLYINAHGTSTPMNDKMETAAIKLALGEAEAKSAVISSTKSMTGHLLGAAGAIEMIATAMTLKNGIAHPTMSLTESDPDCDLDYTPMTARRESFEIAISNSFGFGGHNACVALRPYKG